MTTFIYREDEYGNRNAEIYEVDDNGDETLYMQRGSPVKYPYGMWKDMLVAGTKHPGLQQAIEQAVLMYYLLRQEEK